MARVRGPGSQRKPPVSAGFGKPRMFISDTGANANHANGMQKLNLASPHDPPCRSPILARDHWRPGGMKGRRERRRVALALDLAEC